jgi:hypothetical protein
MVPTTSTPILPMVTPIAISPIRSPWRSDLRQLFVRKRSRRLWSIQCGFRSSERRLASHRYEWNLSCADISGCDRKHVLPSVLRLPHPCNLEWSRHQIWIRRQSRHSVSQRLRGPESRSKWELNETITDPDLTAWSHTNAAGEVGDLCNFQFGNKFYLSNGAVANITLGGKNYLIQQNWVNDSGGFCAMGFSQQTKTSLNFVPVAPCRVADTRNPNGPFGGPILSGNTTRGFAIPASACGIPSNAVAYSLNFTVVPPGKFSFLTAFPCGESQPLASTLNSDGRIKAVAGIVPGGGYGWIRLYLCHRGHSFGSRHRRLFCAVVQHRFLGIFSGDALSRGRYPAGRRTTGWACVVCQCEPDLSHSFESLQRTCDCPGLCIELHGSAESAQTRFLDDLALRTNIAHGLDLECIHGSSHRERRNRSGRHKRRCRCVRYR